MANEWNKMLVPLVSIAVLLAPHGASPGPCTPFHVTPFQSNQEEVQSFRGEILEAVADPPICLFSTTFAWALK